MDYQSEVIKRIEAQDLISRFRSKEDLYRYLIGQSKTQALSLLFGIVNLFLPSLDGTKIVFLRAILKQEKKLLRFKLETKLNHVKQEEFDKFNQDKYQIGQAKIFQRSGLSSQKQGMKQINMIGQQINLVIYQTFNS